MGDIYDVVITSVQFIFSVAIIDADEEGGATRGADGGRGHYKKIILEYPYIYRFLLYIVRVLHPRVGVRDKQPIHRAHFGFIRAP